MQKGKFNVIIDGFWGSSGKGKVSTWLADHFGVTRVSSSNFPNAGHTASFEDGVKFIAKAIPTAAILNTRGKAVDCYISPGSGFSWQRLHEEWEVAGRPSLFIHERASIVTAEHAARERDGADSTKHIASTMQGSGAAMVDKIMRRPECELAGQYGIESHQSTKRINVLSADVFRQHTQGAVLDNHITWLHEGSQGYSLSIDHGSHYPHCTSRNCTVQQALDHMAMPPQSLGDVYINLRTFPIRVGNVVEDGHQLGYSGGFYPDCTETTWDAVATGSGMPEDEALALAERERTTVTKRIRRVCNFSFVGLRDAVRTNGGTKLCMNFIQYLNWKDAGLRGGKKAFARLSSESRVFIDAVEEVAGVPVVLIGTGANHEDMISLL